MSDKHKIPLIQAFLAFLLIAAAGCQTYKEQTFDPKIFLEEVKTERDYRPENFSDSSLFSFETAAQWMSRNSPQIKQLKEQYAVFYAVAEQPMPWPNPSIEGGPNLNFHSPGGPFERVSPFITIGFVIPLGPRLFRENDLNEAKAMQAYQQILVGHRDFYLKLRESYITCSIMQRKVLLAEQIAQMARDGEKLSRKLEKAGYIGALDVYEAVVERGRQEVSSWEEEQLYTLDLAAISTLTGGKVADLSAKNFEPLPHLPLELPNIDSLREMMIQNNPQLAALETRRLVTDCQYRLELAKQIPDLVVGSNYGAEFDRTQTVGLTAGMQIPIFDRNQIAIAESRKTRDLIAQEYRTLLASEMNTLDQIISRYQLIRKKIQLVETDLIPNAERSKKLAESGTSKGVITALQLLRIQRDYRTVLREHLVLYEQLWQLQTQLERTIGYPLAFFKGEKETLVPAIDLKDWDELVKEGEALEEAARQSEDKPEFYFF